MAVDLGTQIEHDALPRPLQEVRLHVLRGERSQQHGEEDGNHAIEPRQVAGGNMAIDGDLDQVRLREAAGGMGEDHRQSAQHLRPIRPQVAQQPAHERGVVRFAECFVFVQCSHYSVSLRRRSQQGEGG